MTDNISLDTNYNINDLNIQGCGVYFVDCDVNSDSGTDTRPIMCIPASINILSKLGSMNNRIDAVIVFPGFKVILYEPKEFNESGTKYTIDNTEGSNVVILGTSLANSITSVRVYYLGTEISLTGFSTYTNPSL